MIRRPWFILMAAVCSLAAFTLTGCKGTINSQVNNATSATGVWGGTDSATGLSVQGYIDSNGSAVFIRSDGVQFVGPTQVSGDTLVAAVIVYTNFGSTFPDGSTYGLGTINGTVAAGSTLTLTVSFTTNGGATAGGSWSLAFNSLTNTGSSLSTISANYTDTASGSVISISGNGVMSGQNPANSCVLNGTVTIINSTYDIYQVSLTYENCTGAYAVLNGVQLTGFAVFNSSSAPTQLSISVVGASTATKFGLLLNLQG